MGLNSKDSDVVVKEEIVEDGNEYGDFSFSHAHTRANTNIRINLICTLLRTPHIHKHAFYFCSMLCWSEITCKMVEDFI